MSDRVLRQSEVDALVRAVREGRVRTGRRSLARAAHAQRVDLRDSAWSQDRIIRRRLPVLDLVFNRLGPALQITLTKSLRFPVRTERRPVELQKFGDFMHYFEGKASLFGIMRLDPLRGFSLIAFDPAVIYALIDALMGGLGVADIPAERELSDIEASLIHKTHAEILRDFENAWRPWFPLRIEHIRSERNVQALSTIPDEEVCHIGSISITGDVLPASPLYFVLPYTSVEPLLEATTARVGEEVDPNWRLNIEKNVRNVRAEVRGIVGDTRLPLSRLRSLAPGDVIRLDRRSDEDIDVLVEGHPLFRARMGSSHQSYALRITERRRIYRELVDRTVGQVLVRKGLISREQLAVVQVDELLNRRPLIDSIVSRGWVERSALEAALHG